ncbi:MAG: NTP transferase domain-containing protein [Planctomycetota bacterium]
MTIVAIVPAAGKGRRMGSDKALLDLGGTTAIERIAHSLLAAGVDELLVVRSHGAEPLPELPIAHRIVLVTGDGDMSDSLRAAESQLDASCATVIVLPVDHALVEADTIAAVAAMAMRTGASIARPTFRGKPGHPVAMRREAFAAIRSQGSVLRDLVRADRSKVRDVPTANAWVLADLDQPRDLEAARAALAAEPGSVVEHMRRHRSRRSYSPTPLLPGQLERLVDAARCASTSSFIQAYAVVAVEDPVRKREVSKLCADQKHVDEAPVFVAICADLHKIAAACEQHGQTVQAQSFELFLQATIDAALLAQNLALACESEGLGICMIGAARNQPIELARLLQLPTGCYVAFGMTIGTPSDDPVARGRMPLMGVLHRETYDATRTEAVLLAADASMREWATRCNERGGYQGRLVNLDKGWSDRMAQLWGERSSYVAARANLVAELKSLGFDLR